MDAELDITSTRWHPGNSNSLKSILAVPMKKATLIADQFIDFNNSNRDVEVRLPTCPLEGDSTRGSTILLKLFRGDLCSNRRPALEWAVGATVSASLNIIEYKE